MKMYAPLPLLHELQEQLAVARRIQQSLLPQPERNLSYVHACSRTLPCYEIGGDYLDYFDLDGGRFFFALGDVAGKGISAALLASKVQGILSAQSFPDSSLPAIISNLNRNLAKRGIDNRFVTFFFGILDPDGNCSYINAGHDPQMLVHPDGSLTELAEGGTVLGLFPEARYESHTVRLHPGDHLVLFTDGITEALNAEGEEYGKERLRALLHGKGPATAPELLSSLQEAVASFAAGTPQHDDITLMVLGFRESETPPALQPGVFSIHPYPMPFPADRKQISLHC
jgi:sigma-B regulation protein RsbU (phosphoserine phosphatase)